MELLDFKGKLHYWSKNCRFALVYNKSKGLVFFESNASECMVLVTPQKEKFFQSLWSFIAIKFDLISLSFRQPHIALVSFPTQISLKHQ